MDHARTLTLPQAEASTPSPILVTEAPSKIVVSIHAQHDAAVQMLAGLSEDVEGERALEKPKCSLELCSCTVPVNSKTSTLYDYREAEETVTNEGVVLEFQPLPSGTESSALRPDAGLLGIIGYLHRCSIVEGSSSGLAPKAQLAETGTGSGNASDHSVLVHADEKRHDLENLDIEKGRTPLENPTATQELERGKSRLQERLDRATSHGERMCRVCYLALDAQPGSESAMELGCACKNDLAVAHRQCAEAWFKIKGNRTCEICGSTVHNVVGAGDTSFMESWNERDASTAAASDGARCWQNHRLFNFLLACMVFAFVLPWLFHVTSIFS